MQLDAFLLRERGWGSDAATLPLPIHRAAATVVDSPRINSAAGPQRRAGNIAAPLENFGRRVDESTAASSPRGALAQCPPLRMQVRMLLFAELVRMPLGQTTDDGNRGRLLGAAMEWRALPFTLPHRLGPAAP
jgi:hypothetical protein